MIIVDAYYTESGSINVVIENQPLDMVISVPPDPDNKDYRALLEWEAQGGEIKAYQEEPQTKPAEPTLEERVTALEERVTVLEAQ